MRIKSLRIKNVFLGWEFEQIDFSLNLTLLVGVSGVGKTQILESINSLKDIANGKSINGIEWDINFSTVAGNDYIWKGGFSILEEETNLFARADDERETLKPTILFEQLLDSKGDLLIDRDLEKIIFDNKKMPKLSSNQSLIHVLEEEPIMREIVEAFNQITLKDNTRRDGLFSAFSPKLIPELKGKYNSLEAIKNSNEYIRIKLLLCSELNLSIFNTIKNRFMDIFPQVEDIKIEHRQVEMNRPSANFIMPIIAIKEKGVSGWISEHRISSGMLRTIIHISDLFLSSNGAVILIDEFENSLGTNCIDILTDDLIHENKSIQFIATSHHPYIINNIPYEYWKIVSRKGGKIQIRNAASYNLGKSKQEAFIQLTKILETQF